MKLHLNLSLRRALLAAIAAVSTVSGISQAGVVDPRYDLQYYLDFCYNKGMFSAGATNIEVFFKDGTSIEDINSYADNNIALMPNMDSYGDTLSGLLIGNKIASNGGTNLVSSQFAYGAKHVHEKVGNTPVAFLAENGVANIIYDSANLDYFGKDSSLQRLTKLVTAVAYTPMATDEFMSSIKVNETRIFRIGGGGKWCDGKTIATGDNPLGGVVNLSVCRYDSSTGEWSLQGWARSAGQADDILTPLDIGTYFGDSGSPCFAWDDANNQFVFVGANWAGGCQLSFPNWYLPQYNYRQGVAVIDKYTIGASFSGSDIIEWSASDAASGKGTLTQGSATVVEYTGKGTDNTLADSLGLTFSTEDTTIERELQLQGNVNMGAGALTFENGKWKLTELADSNFTLSSAGFELKKGAELTWELTGSASQEIRKVGEGTLTIAGSGNNESTLVVGGGSTVYNVTRDAEGNITGCTLGNAGETRLNRTDGYAASSVRLEGGVAIIVLMGDNQFKTNETGGDTFTFGNDGGLLNLNGHNLSWEVINQEGSGKGARIGNLTPLGESKPGNSTFTYTGTDAFHGCFMDEGTAGAQLAVVYNNATEGATWKLTGNHTNAGGFTVQNGTMVLEGTKTPHVLMSDAHDWTYASMDTSSVTVKNGAAFQLSHHALLKGDVNVEAGGSFVLNQSANAASESISGGLRQDMEKLGITSLIGNVVLNGTSQAGATMTADTNSPVTTTMKGNITGTTNDSFTKTGSGTFVVDGQLAVGRGGTVQAGGLVVKDATNFFGSWTNWKIQEQGFLAVAGVDTDRLLPFVDPNSAGVLALTANQATELNLKGTYQEYSNLIIGAYGTVDYGTTSATLTAVTDSELGSVWRLGGGTGTLNVLFQLTGDTDLIIGNDYSSGTVHLANTANNFTGDIYIKGTGNMLTYEEGALGGAKVALTYGNTLALNDAGQLSILKDGALGVLAISDSMELDLTGKPLSIGAVGEVTLTDKVTVSDDTYRFGGKGNLTLDIALTGATRMELDGQGNSGSSVTFAKEDAYSGSIVAGGGLHLDSANSAGDIGIHAGHAESFANLAAMELQQGSTLYTDGQSLTVNNLTAGSGSSIRNNGETASLLQLNVDSDKETTIADGVLLNAANTAALGLVKTGDGTLNMGGNTSWSGGLTIMDGTVKGSIANGGIGASGASIYVQKGATLQLTSGATNDCKQLGSTILQQKLSGDGAVSISNGNDMLFLNQASGLFTGQVNVTGNTRLYITKDAAIDSTSKFSTSQAFDKATIVVEAGSQARVTPSIFSQSTTSVNSWADYVISGSDFRGKSSGLVQSQDDGALLIDCLATVWGNVTLADDATVSSWSHNPTTSQYFWGNYPYYCGPASNDYGNHYGVINRLGGIIRGQILGEGKTLTIGGNESMTITADSRNTFKDLVIANKNGSNDDKFALRLDGGSAVSQTSTALGTGKVTLGDGLILRLAGTGSANQSDVTYTYANNITAGDDATLQSHNITNKLTGTVTMTGSALNLATANGGALNLAGGISGSGTVNIAAGSRVIIGSLTSTAAAAQFAVVAGSGADITLNSPTTVATTISGTDSLALRLGDSEDYSFGGITLIASTEGSSTSLTLDFDFTNDTSWSALRSDITADSTVVEISLNMFNDIKSGNYTLATGELGGSYSLADTLNGRLSLKKENGTLELNVTEDNRLYWTADSATQEWNGANWYQETSGGKVAFSAGSHVMLDSTGVSEGNSATARETINLTGEQTVGSLAAKDAGSYYEVTGTGSLSGDKLVVGNNVDLKLSTASATFTSGVQVDNAALEVSGTNLTANVTVTDGALKLTEATLNGNISAAGTGRIDLTNAALGSNTISFENGTGIQTTNATMSGAMEWTADKSQVQMNGTLSTGQLRTTASIESDTMALAGNTSLTIADSGESTYKSITGVNDGQGSLYVENGSTPTLNLGSAALNYASLRGGETIVTGAVDVKGQLSIGKATLTIAEGGSIKANRLTACNEADYSPSTIIIDGGKLEITGTANNKNTSDSLLLGHWKYASASLSLLSGELKATGAVLHTSWNSAGTFEAHGGHADLKGINLKGQASGTGTFKLGSADSGSATVTIGSSGISSIEGDASVSLGNGTIAASADFSISGSKAVNVIGTTTGTTFDTDGHTITIETAISGNGSLNKTGAGTLKLAGDGTSFTGALSVQEGTLELGGSTAVGTLAGLSVIDNGALDLSGIDFAGGNAGLALTEGAKACFGSGASIVFGDLTAETTYSIFSLGSGATLEGWSGLTTANFTINGMKMTEMGRVSLALNDAAGTFTYYSDSYDLVWSGPATGGTWNRDESNTSWTRLFGGAPEESPTGFANLDNVSFNSDANVTVAERVAASNLTIAENTHLTTKGAVTITGSISTGAGSSWTLAKGTEQSLSQNQVSSISSLVVAEGAALSISNTGMEGYSSTNITGDGTVNVHLSSNVSNSVNLGDTFTGTTYIRGGALQLSGAQVGSTLRLADGVVVNVNADFAANIILDGTSEFRPGNSVAFNGSVTGDGMINHTSNCYYTFNGEVNLGGFKNTDQNQWGRNFFNGSTTLGEVLCDGGHFYFNNTSSIGTLSLAQTSAGSLIEFAADKNHSIANAQIQGGTININGTTTVGNLTQTGGQINIGGSVEITGRLNGTGGTLATKGGEVVLAYIGTDGNTINQVDGAMTGGNTAEGTLRLAENVKLTVTGNMWTRSNTGILLDKGAELNISNKSLVIKNEGSAEARFGASTSTGKQYDKTESNYEIRNARVTNTADGNVSLTNQLVNSTVENAGNGTFTLNHTANSISGVVASGGNVTLQSMGEAMSLDLLEIAAGKTVNAYVGTNADTKSSVTVTGSALLSGTAALNTSLTLAEGAGLDMSDLDSGAVTLNGALTFGGKVTMDENLLAIVNEMSGWEESITLFTGLSKVSLPGVTEAASAEKVLASNVFSNVTNNQVYISYQVIDNVGSLMVVHVPEPTTSTLSLLALAALVARRRRKQ